MPTAIETADDFARQLIAFWEGKVPASKVFTDNNRKKLMKRIVRQMSLRAPDLASDLAEDVVQNLMVDLRVKGTFTGSPDQLNGYIKCCILNAIRTVRAENRLPGHRSRIIKPTGDKSGFKPKLVFLDDTDTNTGQSVGETVACPDDPILHAEDVISAQQILTFAEATAPTVAAALSQMYHNDLSMAQAAKEIGIHRTTLQRNMNSWAERYSSQIAA